jgi:large subunit ribosomal protein L23
MDIILKPVVTEKMNLKGESLKQYGFIVDKRANKVQIKKAVEELYGVTVESVNTMRYAGKRKSRMTKTGLVTGKRNTLKKAMVTLREGETIDFYSNI